MIIPFFSKQQGQSIVLLVVYMNDIVVIGNNLEEVTTLKAFLDDKFKFGDLGELNYFLGMKIIKVPNGIVLMQKKLAMDLLK